MNARTFALIAGVAYTIVGLMGLFGIGVMHHGPADHLSVDAQFGHLLGLFPVNVLHNVVHIAIGLWGLAAYSTFRASRGYSKSLAVIYGALAVMGLFPLLKTTFGLVPIYGHDVWLHAVTAAAAAYFGFSRVHAPNERTTAHA